MTDSDHYMPSLPKNGTNITDDDHMSANKHKNKKCSFYNI